jgi:Uma2 family endonuclease
MNAMSIPVSGVPRPHRLTADDYHRMGEAGILRPDARVELIDGEIIDMAPIGSRHAAAVEQLSRILQQAVGERALVRHQNPVRLGTYSEPQPDISLVRARADFYRAEHPSAADVFLIVEISDTSLSFDRTVKVSLYARHGVPEVWIVDLTTQVLTRYRRPDVHSGLYRDVDDPDLAVDLELHAWPATKVGAGALFPASVPADDRRSGVDPARQD